MEKAITCFEKDGITFEIHTIDTKRAHGAEDANKNR